jgi:hypothetical protein
MDEETSRPIRRRPITLALIVFCFHLPGLRLLGGARISRRMAVYNAIALGLTIAVMLACRSLLPPADAWTGLVAAFLVGHFGWSTFAAIVVYRGKHAE